MTMPDSNTTAAIEAAGSLAARIRDAIGRVIVGSDEAVELLLVALLSDGHVLLQDVPGMGKTTLAKSLARSLGCSFRRIQCSPDLTPADIVGVSVYDQRSGAFAYHPGPIHAQVIIVDEINRATPRTQSSLLEAMEERQISVDGVTKPLPRPFLVLATQNPIELEGTFPLPEAQLDRFLLRVRMGYPDASEEDQILLRFEASNPLETLQPIIQAAELSRLAALLPSVHCEPAVRDYIVRIIRATRDHASVELGASPRASLALFRASRALAAVRGRDFVMPDDVKALATPVLSHRIMLTGQSRLRGRSAEPLVQEILETQPVPIKDS
jgi:MoxR-like ATPase